MFILIVSHALDSFFFAFNTLSWHCPFIMQDIVLDTLFLPLTKGLLGDDLQEKNVIGFNLRSHNVLQGLRTQNNLYVQQYFKSYAQIMSNSGICVLQDMPADIKNHDVAFIRSSKSARETGGFIVEALRVLKNDAILVIAAANDEGAGRYKKILEKLGLDNVKSLSKNKARVIWGHYSGEKNDAYTQMLEDGNWQSILSADFVSKPGIFGWNKEDSGSKLLLSTISDDIKGNIADFGCGYGYLSVNILKNFSKIEKISCIDADYRAIQACEKNLKGINKSVQHEFLWEDLTKDTSVKNLDYIIMNPPFHEGKNTDVGIGVEFIDTAHNALKKGGVMWMVANAHLPYENVLHERFDHVQKMFEGQGFKVFRAIK